MYKLFTVEELLEKPGENIRAERLQNNIDQITLARMAGVSLTALKHLESGQGSTLKTFIRILKALGQEEQPT